MAEGLNTVTLLGNLGEDPELRMTGGGQAICKIRLATTESYVDKSNTRQERTEWHSVTVFGARGEALAKLVAKGDRLCVVGRLSTSSYEKDGEKRYRTEVIATTFFLCGGKKAGGQERHEERPARRAEPDASRANQAPANRGDAYDDDDIPF
jgi:single-strand DNA-binding protein